MAEAYTDENDVYHDTFDSLMEDYTLSAAIVPLEGWGTADLATLQTEINAELQRRHDNNVPDPQS